MMPESEKIYKDYRFHEKRVAWTVDFVRANLNPGAKILDLGPKNILSQALQNEGYIVENANSQDLDVDYDCVKKEGVDAFTSFEVFEHLVSPLPLLKAVQAPLLITSVPLSLWFARAYRGNLEEDRFDEHYHEFEPWQFELLLRKSGWCVSRKELHASFDKRSFGIRPILRRFYPRYLIVAATRS
jgi:hypothetical protein